MYGTPDREVDQRSGLGRSRSPRPEPPSSPTQLRPRHPHAIRRPRSSKELLQLAGRLAGRPRHASKELWHSLQTRVRVVGAVRSAAAYEPDADTHHLAGDALQMPASPPGSPQRRLFEGSHLRVLDRLKWRSPSGLRADAAAGVPVPARLPPLRL